MFYLALGRIQKRLTQKQFAKKVRVDAHHISECERGAVWPTPDQIQRFAEVLGIPPEKVMQAVPPASIIASEVREVIDDEEKPSA